MKSIRLVVAGAALLAFAASSAFAAGVSVPLPGGQDGIRLDDYYFDPLLGRLVVPAGRTGSVALIDPKTRAIETIGGFSAPAPSAGMVAGGPTSADAGEGTILVTDRSDRRLYVVDAGKRAILGGAALASGPDYVRYVGPTREAWVTEPRDERIEVFSLEKASVPVHEAFIGSTRGEYEALVVDASRGRAYSNQGAVTTALDLKTRGVVATWKNGCESAEGLALDEARGFLMVACREGRVEVLDVTRKGTRLSSVKAGEGVDIIAYWPATRRLYIPSSNAATVTFATLSEKGLLRAIKTVPGVKGGHCAAADGSGVWTCDGRAGALVYFRNP